MTETYNPMKALEIRAGELESNLILVQSRILDATQQLEKKQLDGDQAVVEALDSYFKLGQIQSDIFWMTSLAKIGVPPREIMEAWNIKDDQNRRLKNKE